jgi:cytochrome c-type biogenesis protein CcsB
LDEIFIKPPASRSRFDKDLIKLDEQINILYQLINGEMITVFPEKDDPNHQWYASGERMEAYYGKVLDALKTGDWKPADKALDAIRTYQEENSTLDIAPQKIKAELLYNRLNIFRLCKLFYLIAGGLLLVLLFVSLFGKSRKTWSLPAKFLIAIIAIAALGHLFGIGLRWYIAGYAPWSNAYETMIYVSFITVVAGLLFVRRSAIPFALSTLFGGVILFVSGLNWMDPQISPLVPVLKSPWLMIHVAVIVAAYGFFGISFLLGVTNLILSPASRNGKNATLAFRLQELTIINEMSLWIGLILMTTGTFVGAVWANESWGRYWGWDPKETWALVSIVVYAVVTHLHLVKKWDNPRLFNLLSVLAFACVLMTYFGVNYFLSGMHSYGR